VAAVEDKLKLELAVLEAIEQTMVVQHTLLIQESFIQLLLVLEVL
jgi:hypothetical protein